MTTPDLRTALELLNSLGIDGPNMRHGIRSEPDPKWSRDERAVWEMTKDQTWCVCDREWPCEALQLADIIRAALADTDEDLPEYGDDEYNGRIPWRP